MLGRKRKPAESRWKIYAYYDTKAQMARAFKKLQKDGYDVQWNKSKGGRYALRTRLR